MAKKSRKKSGWHDFKHGGTHERRLYKKGKVIAKVPIKKDKRKKNATFEGPNKNSGVDKRKAINREKRSI